MLTAAIELAGYELVSLEKWPAKLAAAAGPQTGNWARRVARKGNVTALFAVAGDVGEHQWQLHTVTENPGDEVVPDQEVGAALRVILRVVE